MKVAGARAQVRRRPAEALRPGHGSGDQHDAPRCSPSRGATTAAAVLVAMLVAAATLESRLRRSASAARSSRASCASASIPDAVCAECADITLARGRPAPAASQPAQRRTLTGSPSRIRSPLPAPIEHRLELVELPPVADAGGAPAASLRGRRRRRRTRPRRSRRSPRRRTRASQPVSNSSVSSRKQRATASASRSIRIASRSRREHHSAGASSRDAGRQVLPRADRAAAASGGRRGPGSAGSAR